MVEVKIGKTGASTSIHKDRLCAASAFFDKAFNGPFKEANEKEMIIEDVEIAVFDSFVEWLYDVPITTAEGYKEPLDHLAQVYILGDRFMCAGLKDHVMDKIQDVMQHIHCAHGCLVPVETARKIFENTLSSTDAPIRLYCAALVSLWVVSGRAHDEVEEFFKIQGFLKEFVAYQASALKTASEFDRFNMVGSADIRHSLTDDPRRRGYYSAFAFDDVHEVGHRICFFHSHDPNVKCTSKTNRVSLRDFDSDDYGDGSDLECW